jgi:hypothetical protein
MLYDMESYINWFHETLKDISENCNNILHHIFFIRISHKSKMDFLCIFIHNILLLSNCNIVDWDIFWFIILTGSMILLTMSNIWINNLLNVKNYYIGWLNNFAISPIYDLTTIYLLYYFCMSFIWIYWTSQYLFYT